MRLSSYMLSLIKTVLTSCRMLDTGYTARSKNEHIIIFMELMVKVINI